MFIYTSNSYQKKKCKINLDKPIYIGTSILGLSKASMQDFHYNYIKNEYGAKPEMLLTDTDSFMYKDTSAKIKSYLTSVITQKIQNIAIMQIM